MRIAYSLSFLMILASTLTACSQQITPVDEVSVDPDRTIAEAGEIAIDKHDWPQWRGPNLDGRAPQERVPVSWSDTENVVWKTPIPGRGHSSPTIVGDRLFLATADEKEQVQSVLCFERETGKQLWKQDLHRGNFPGSSQMHVKSSHATCTVASDGERLFVAFLNDDAISATALDFDGEQLWQQKLGAYDAKFGYAPSPVLFGPSVIFAADNRGGGYLAAVHRQTGEVLWRKARPAVATYASPAVLNVAGKDQLLISGCDKISSYDPSTGEALWEVDGTTEATVGTMVGSGDFVFAAGGYPGAGTFCVRADGSGEIVWQNRQKVYVPSMLLHQGHLFAVADNGIALCWNAESGEERWKQRLGGGDVSASPVLAGEHIYAANEKGTVFVFKADPNKFELVAENQLGDEMFATPVAAGGRLYLRVADSSSGTRQETLYCIGTAETSSSGAE